MTGGSDNKVPGTSHAAGADPEPDAPGGSDATSSERGRTGETGAADTASLDTGPPAEPVAASDAARRELSPAARRALAEAEERRRQSARNETTGPRELGGREGPDPVRYGDWEKGGIASDF